MRDVIQKPFFKFLFFLIMADAKPSSPCWLSFKTGMAFIDNERNTLFAANLHIIFKINMLGHIKEYPFLLLINVSRLNLPSRKEEIKKNICWS